MLFYVRFISKFVSMLLKAVAQVVVQLTVHHIPPLTALKVFPLLYFIFHIKPSLMKINLVLQLQVLLYYYY